jgi:hypothetical protein
MVQAKSTDSWQFMVDAATRGVEEQGYKLEKLPGRGLSNVWTIQRNGEAQSASIRTTRDRWIAFPPLEGGKRWKTLDDVDLVIVSAVNSKEDPKNIEVYIFQARDVRQRFDAAYNARRKAGRAIRDDFGMWIGLDKDERGGPTSIGSGIAEQHRPVAVYSIESLMPGIPKSQPEPDNLGSRREPSETEAPITISDVMAWARKRVSEIAGVRVEAIKLDLKIEY